MKKLIILPLIFLITSAFSQTLRYEDIKGERIKGTFEKYISKTGEEYSIGDTIFLGTPSGANDKYLHIFQYDFTLTSYPIPSQAANTSVVIKKIQVAGTKGMGFSASFRTSGMMATTYYNIAIDNAIESGEIKSKIMSSDEALAKLKKAKDKLDLGLITEEEFNKLRTELAPLID